MILFYLNSRAVDSNLIVGDVIVVFLDCAVDVVGLGWEVCVKFCRVISAGLLKQA